MQIKRSSGVLMHVSSLYGTDSIGGFGREAREFIDFLADCGFTWWQVLPFCMSDEYNSPYKSLSAFAGNPYFIDLRRLREAGLLTEAELTSVREETPYSAEYERLYETRLDLLRLAASRLGESEQARIQAFLQDDPYIRQACDFMARRRVNGDRPWYEWSISEVEGLPTYRQEYAVWGFIQYTFMQQWQEIHEYATHRGVKIMGDMPIYVAYDSCDVYANREQFLLDGEGAPTAVAGCPPDYFAKDGQLWGNPLYDWAHMKQDGYTWWSARMKHMLSLFDGVRIDHFRGLEAYWSIPADAETAREGHWEPGPGMPLIHAFREVAEQIRTREGREVLILAEDLGESTPSLKQFVTESGFPCMRVLQFAFDGDPDNIHLPYNYDRATAAYTGTHDNNTLLGFVWEADPTTRRRLLRYCGFTATDWNCPEAYRAVMRTLFASPAALAILPIQDILGYGADTRMNVPGHAEGNWRYRITREQLNSIDRAFCRELNQLYGR